MNRLEAAKLLDERKLRWPATIEALDSVAEVDLWTAELAPFGADLVREVMLEHVGQFGPTLSEVAEVARARDRGRSQRRPTSPPSLRECPTCGRSPFGPHRGQDPCRTCGRDDAPAYARMQREPAVAGLETTDG